MTDSDWNKIHRLLNDDEYVNRSSFMVCYSNAMHRAHPPSNTIKTKKEFIKDEKFVPGSHLPKFASPMRKTRRKVSTNVA